MVVDAPKHFLKLVMITGGSAVFGGVIALFMLSPIQPRFVANRGGAVDDATGTCNDGLCADLGHC